MNEPINRNYANGNVNPAYQADPTVDVLAGQNAAAVNQAQQAKVVDGSDSATPAGQRAAVLVRDPVLPEVSGSRQTLNLDPGRMASWSGGKPLSLAAGINMLIEIGAKSQLIHGKNRTAQGQMSAKLAMASADMTKEEVAGKRQQAVVALAGAVAGFVVGVTFAGVGARWQSKDQPDIVHGAMATAGGMAASQATTALFTAVDTNSSVGGQYKADEARIKKAIIDAYQQQFKSNEDAFNASYDDARKKVESVLDLMRQSADATNQTMISINNNV